MNRMALLAVIVFFAFLRQSLAESNESYSVAGKIMNYAGKHAYLAEFYGESKNVIDTADIDSAGNFSFSLGARNQAGLYRIIFGRNKFADIVFNKEDVAFETDFPDIFGTINIKKSVETRTYYDYLRRRNESEYMLDLIKPLIANFPRDDEFYKSALDKFLSIEKALRNYTDSVIDELPEAYVSRLLKTDRLPVFDPALDDIARTAFLDRHFFDETDFNDISLINSNVIPQKIIAYLTLHTDKNLTKEEQEKRFFPAVDTILTKASVNGAMYDFALDYIVNGFETFNYQEVLKHIADNFAPRESCENAERKSKLDKILEGQKNLANGAKAPDITLPGPNGGAHSLYGVNSKYTLLLFWAGWCEHCRELLPELKKLYEGPTGDKMQVFAVSLDTDKESWTAALAGGEYSWKNCSDLKGWDSPAANLYYVYGTPTMFLLDKDKTIIARPVSIPEIKNKIIELENR